MSSLCHTAKFYLFKHSLWNYYSGFGKIVASAHPYQKPSTKDPSVCAEGQTESDHSEKKGSQNGASEEPFWKTAPLWQSGAIFSFIIMFRKKTAPFEKEEPK